MAATAAGAQPTPAQVVSRDGAVSETAPPVAPEMLKAVFRAPRPAGPGKASAGTVTLASWRPGGVRHHGGAKRRGRQPIDPGADGTARAGGRQRKAAAEFSAYLQELERSAKIKRNDKVFEQ